MKKFIKFLLIVIGVGLLILASSWHIYLQIKYNEGIEHRRSASDRTYYFGKNDTESVCAITTDSRAIKYWSSYFWSNNYWQKFERKYTWHDFSLLYKMQSGDTYIWAENIYTGEKTDRFNIQGPISRGLFDSIDCDSEIFERNGDLNIYVTYVVYACESKERQCYGAYIYNISQGKYEYFVEKEFDEEDYKSYLEQAGEDNNGYEMYGRYVTEQPEFSEISNYYYNNENCVNQMMLLNESFLAANGFVDENNRMQLEKTHDGICNRDGIPFHMDASLLPENSARLYDEFPELESYKGSEAGEYYVGLAFSHRYTPEDIMQMLIGDDRDVSYDGVYVPEEYSKDNQCHYIDSYEEYMEYLDPQSIVCLDRIAIGGAVKWGLMLTRYEDQESIIYL